MKTVDVILLEVVGLVGGFVVIMLVAMSIFDSPTYAWRILAYGQSDTGDIDSVDDPVIRYVPELAGRGLDTLTIRDLLLMNSGIRYQSGDDLPSSCSPSATTQSPTTRQICARQPCGRRPAARLSARLFTTTTTTRYWRA